MTPMRVPLSVLVLAGVVFASGPVSAQMTASKAPTALTPRTATSTIFTEPGGQFSLAVPPGGDVQERNGNSQIAIRSRKGYMINLQWGPARPAVPVASMHRFLEAKYLGQGRPWSVKNSSRAAVFAGLPAHDAVYEGAGTRARAVILRGAKSDFVFIFLAPANDYQNLEHEFEWVLKHFRPGAEDLPRPKDFGGKDSQEFAEPGYGYSIRYPREWKASKPAAMTTMFSGREGTEAYAAIVSVQNVQPAGVRNGVEAADRALHDIKDVLKKSVRKLEFVSEEPWKYGHGPIEVGGRRLIATYVHGGQRFQKQIIVVPRPNRAIAHIWSFTAPEKVFKSYTAVAEHMLSTWTLLTDSES